MKTPGVGTLLQGRTGTDSASLTMGITTKEWVLDF